MRGSAHGPLLIALLLGCRAPATQGSPSSPASAPVPEVEEGPVTEAAEATAPAQPTADRDADGVPDALDGCPDEPEDLDQFEDGDGCVDRDNDGDGILDAHEFKAGRWTNCDYKPVRNYDQDCRNMPEDFDGVADHDGCPDVTSLSVCATKIARVDLDRRGRLTVDAQQVLDEVAAIMKAAPDVTIWVEAHIDKQRDPAVAKRISQRAAEEVSVALVGRGIGSERLEPIGWGDSRPLDRNATAAERARNRRVEFWVRDCERHPGPRNQGDTPESHECR